MVVWIVHVGRSPRDVLLPDDWPWNGTQSDGRGVGAMERSFTVAAEHGVIVFSCRYVSAGSRVDLAGSGNWSHRATPAAGDRVRAKGVPCRFGLRRGTSLQRYLVATCPITNCLSVEAVDPLAFQMPPPDSDIPCSSTSPYPESTLHPSLPLRR